MSGPACCAPSRPGGPAPAHRPALPSSGDAPELVALRLVTLDGGSFRMGCADPPYPGDGEGPVREVRLAPFALAPTPVTNAAFACFAAATGHRTDAERYGWSFVFAGLLPPGTPPTRGVASAPWWRAVEGADWAHPEGPATDVRERPDHPVVHVSWHDAQAYCAWSGTRLPTEAQWEYATRGGLEQQPFPWGDALTPGGRHLMNVWQGRFPVVDTAEDGWAGTCPVEAFPPNAYGLYGTTGNVWEWCADRFGVTHGSGLHVDPTGPATGNAHVLRGGSYLCHASYCRRYRTSARMGNTPDSSSGNTGFRVAAGS